MSEYLSFIILYSIIPSALLIITLLLIFRVFRKKHEYFECTGIITGFYENKSSLKLDSYQGKSMSPIISYLFNDIVYEFIGNFYSTNMKIGSNITILCDKKNIKKPIMKNGLIFAPLITGCLFVLFSLPIVIFLMFF